MRPIAVLALVAACWTAEALAAPAAPQVQLVLCSTPSGASLVHLKLLLLNAGATPPADAKALVAFSSAPGGAALELPAPGPRSLAVPLKASEWPADHTEVLDLGDVSLAPPCPTVVAVSGGLAGQEMHLLGTLRRGVAGAPASFLRAYPQADVAPGGRSHLFFAAAYEPTEDGQFRMKLACLNCGEKLKADYDVFLHFELAPVGTELAATTALGLFPAGRATDSSQWSESDLAVAELGPYCLQAGAPEFIYLRAGLYNRQGDGARLPIAGPDDTSRALIGRLVTREGRTWFERAPLPGAQVPAGWSAPRKGVGQ